jgi:hypothetical protein
MCLECETRGPAWLAETLADGPPKWLRPPGRPALLKPTPKRKARKDTRTLPLLPAVLEPKGR